MRDIQVLCQKDLISILFVKKIPRKVGILRKLLMVSNMLTDRYIYWASHTKSDPLKILNALPDAYDLNNKHNRNDWIYTM